MPLNICKVKMLFKNEETLIMNYFPNNLITIQYTTIQQVFTFGLWSAIKFWFWPSKGRS